MQSIHYFYNEYDPKMKPFRNEAEIQKHLINYTQKSEKMHRKYTHPKKTHDKTAYKK